jgi:autotransporter-associated beta strand protein
MRQITNIHRIFHSACFATLSLSWVASAFAAEITATWTGPAGGSWSNPANWNIGQVPINNGTDVFNVIIPAGKSVLLDSGVAPGAIVNQFELQGNSTFSITVGRQLSVTGFTAIDGLVTVDGAGANFTTGPSISTPNNRSRYALTNGASATIYDDNYNTTGIGSTTLFSASGAGALLDLGSIQAFEYGVSDGQNYQYSVSATGGATIDLSGVTTLQSRTGNNSSDLTFNLSAGNSILLDGLVSILAQGNGTDITIFNVNDKAQSLPELVSAQRVVFQNFLPGGSVSAPQLVGLTSFSALDVASGGTFSAPLLTNISTLNLTVRAGANLTFGDFSNIDSARIAVVGDGRQFGGTAGNQITDTSYNTASIGSTTLFSASGAGALLDLGSIQAFEYGVSDGQNYQYSVSATGGATIDLSGVTTLQSRTGNNSSDLTIVANTGGTIDLSSLSSLAFNGNTSDFAIFNVATAGKLLLGGNLGARTQVTAQDTTAQITFTGDTSFAAGSTLNVPAGTALTVQGDLSMTQTVESAFGVDDAVLRFEGTDRQRLEVGGVDSGIGGFTSSNFGIGQLVIGTPAQSASVELADLINNGNRGGSGGNAESLYLYGLGGPAGLIVHPDSVLILNGLNVYAWDPAAGNQVHLNSLFAPGQNRVQYNGGGYLQLSSAFPNAWLVDGSGNWSGAGNWSAGVVPNGSTDEAIFGDALTSGPATVLLNTNATIGTLHFDNDEHSYTIGDDGVHVLTLADAATIDVVAGSHTIASPLAGQNGLNKTGPGTLRLSGDSLYTGPTHVQAGTLRASSADNLGATDSITVDAAATFDVSQGAVYQLRAGQTLTGHGTVKANLLTLLPGSKLGGALRVQGSVASAGRVAPGFSPEIMTIVGNYSQQPSGVLEMELGGTAPGSQHDMLIVTGTASLAGRLELPIIDNYVPQVGHEIQILLAGNVVGDFDSHFVSPSLASINPNVAYELNTTTNGVRLRFVAPSTDNQFQSTAPTTNWADTANWSTGLIPTESDIITVENASAQLQRLDVEEVMVLPNSKNAFTHELTLLGTTQTMAVTVQSGSSLSSTIGVNVGNLGLVELGGGTIVAHDIDIQAGGTVMGNGTIVGKVIVGAAGGPQAATLSPGFSVGHLDVEGDYEQGSGGALLIDVESAAERDTIKVTGQADVGGTLRIDASSFVITTPGEAISIIDAGMGNGQFDDVETIGNDEIYFAPLYGSDTLSCDVYVCVGGYYRGDMNRNGIFDTSDISSFALALTNALAYRNQFGISGSQSGNMDGVGGIDFDDIPLFRSIMQQNGVSTAGLAAAIERMGKPSVPEPSSVVLALCTAGFLSMAWNRRVSDMAWPTATPTRFDVSHAVGEIVAR